MNFSENSVASPRLTVAMIVRDEEAVLAESIRSVESIADEIVVLDTGSVDNTVALARGLGAVVDQAPWTDDFSAARNRCLQNATGDWILWLDAGERLDQETADELRVFLRTKAQPAQGYMLLVRVPPADPFASSEQAARLRLIPNRKDLRFEGRVRETLRPSVEAAGLAVDLAPGRILRHARTHDAVRKIMAGHRDLKLARLEASDVTASDVIGPMPIRLLLARGDAHYNLGELEAAREAFQEAVNAAGRGSTEMLEAYYGLLTACGEDESLSQLLLSTCLEALEIFPLDAQLLLAMGNYLQSNERPGLATRSFETAVKYGQVDLETWHLTELPEIAATCQHLTLQIEGKDDQARQVLEEALGRYPDSTRLRRHLIDLCIRQGRPEEAVASADRLPGSPEERLALQDAIRGACKAANQEWVGALALLQAALTAGCSDPICLRWLAVTLLSNGQVAAAAPVLQLWEQVEPANVELQAYLEVIKQQRTTPSDAPTQPEPIQPEPSDRWLRFDVQTTVMEASPPTYPIISQNASSEASGG